MSFGKETKKGAKIIEGHQKKYEEWWLGVRVNSTQTINKIPAKGKIVKVEYIGNSFSGSVEITLDNNCKLIVCPQPGSYRPKKSDIKYI